MPKEEASYHIQRCIDSGLWVPGGGDEEKNQQADGDKKDEEKKDDDENAEDYEKVD